MLLIKQITSDPLQTTQVILADGTSFTMTLYFRPLQYGWFIKNITYGTFTVNEIRISNLPDILYQFKNQIPFGIACFSKDDREPSLLQDFSSGASRLYLLSADEVASYTTFLENG